MNVNQYKKTMENVVNKAPLESGVQTLVYMLLCEVLENFEFEIVVIDRMRNKSRFTSDAGISDLAVVTPDFNYYDGKGDILFCVEVKAAHVKLSEQDDQVLGQAMTFKRAMFTNGRKWQYYDLSDGRDVKPKWQVDLYDGDRFRDENYPELIKRLYSTFIELQQRYRNNPRSFHLTANNGPKN